MLTLIFMGGGAAASPIADFIGVPTHGDAPLTVNFTDLSSNTPTSWSWNFGDLTTSILQNPSHTYLVPGSYTVALTATNAAGSDTKTVVNYIVAAVPSTGAGGSGYDGRLVADAVKKTLARRRKRRSDVLAAVLMMEED